MAAKHKGPPGGRGQRRSTAGGKSSTMHGKSTTVRSYRSAHTGQFVKREETSDRSSGKSYRYAYRNEQGRGVQVSPSRRRVQRTAKAEAEAFLRKVDALAERITAAWKEDISAVDAVRDQRR
jgi:hypothetical protein